MIKKPSINSIKKFVDRLKKNLQIIIYIINNNYFMKFII
jgi:hypothetical protein